MLDVILESRYLLGRKQVVECDLLHARGILHLDGLNGIDRKLAVYGLKVTQRNQRRGNVDRYDIALLGIVVAGTLRGNEQVFCLAIELVRIGLGFFVDRLARIGKRRAVDDDLGEAVDLHKVAQLVGKRDVAGLGLVVALMDFGRIRRLRCDGLRDVVENLLELFGIGRRLVVVGVFRACTMSIPCRGIGVVARNGLHELVLFLAFSRILDTSAGIRAIKDADSINGGLAVLHVLGSCHGSVSNRRIKLVNFRWRAVGKEHNNLLGVRATRSDTLCQLQTIVGARCTSGCNLGNPMLKSFHVAAGAIGQVFHNLCVIVGVSSVTIRLVADIVGRLARKLNDSNLMLPIHALDALVLFGNDVDEAAGSALQRIDAPGGISTAHLMIHRARGIQHHHDVERRGNRHG